MRRSGVRCVSHAGRLHVLLSGSLHRSMDFLDLIEPTRLCLQDGNIELADYFVNNICRA